MGQGEEKDVAGERVGNCEKNNERRKNELDGDGASKSRRGCGVKGRGSTMLQNAGGRRGGREGC